MPGIGSKIGSQLGFPLGFGASPFLAITVGVSDSLSITDSQDSTNPAFAYEIDDTLTLSDAISVEFISTGAAQHNSRLGTSSCLGFPLGGSTFSGVSLNVAVGDSLSLSDFVDTTDPNISKPVSGDQIVLSDNVAITIGIITPTTRIVADTLVFSDSIIVQLFSTVAAKPGVTQVLIEVAPHAEQGHGPPNIIVTQDVIEWVRHPSDTILATQLAIEFVFHPPDSILATQTLIEVAHKPYPAVPVKAHYKRFLPIRK